MNSKRCVFFIPFLLMTATVIPRTVTSDYPAYRGGYTLPQDIFSLLGGVERGSSPSLVPSSRSSATKMRMQKEPRLREKKASFLTRAHKKAKSGLATLKEKVKKHPLLSTLLSGSLGLITFYTLKKYMIDDAPERDTTLEENEALLDSLQGLALEKRAEEERVQEQKKEEQAYEVFWSLFNEEVEEAFFKDKAEQQSATGFSPHTISLLAQQYANPQFFDKIAAKFAQQRSLGKKNQSNATPQASQDTHSATKMRRSVASQSASLSSAAASRKPLRKAPPGEERDAVHIVQKEIAKALEVTPISKATGDDSSYLDASSISIDPHNEEYDGRKSASVEILQQESHDASKAHELDTNNIADQIAHDILYDDIIKKVNSRIDQSSLLNSRAERVKQMQKAPLSQKDKNDSSSVQPVDKDSYISSNFQRMGSQVGDLMNWVGNTLLGAAIPYDADDLDSIYEDQEEYDTPSTLERVGSVLTSLQNYLPWMPSEYERDIRDYNLKLLTKEKEDVTREKEKLRSLKDVEKHIDHIQNKIPKTKERLLSAQQNNSFNDVQKEKGILLQQEATLLQLEKELEQHQHLDNKLAIIEEVIARKSK